MKEEFKLILRRLWPILLFVVGFPLLSYGIWVFLPSKTLDLIVIDKTVPKDTYQEHAGLFWTLNHLKYKKSTNDSYDLKKDYLGYFPGETDNSGSVNDLQGNSETEIRDLVKKHDLIYFTDSYGVYEGDFSKNQDVLLTKKIYGGLDNSDIQLIRMAKEEDKVLVAEYNTMASPTTKSFRMEFENLMGVKWTGWIARYFDDFDTLNNTLIPKWMIRQYQRQHESWDLSGPGLIFIKESGEIEAFLHSQDYQNKIPLVRTQKINKHGFNLPEVVPYPDWFDVVMIERDYQVISYYDIDPTVDGVQRLRRMGLPRFFPAAIVRNTGNATQYYFAGDYSDIRGNFGSPYFFGLPTLWRGLYAASDYSDQQGFFWNYYHPLISQILRKSQKESN